VPGVSRVPDDRIADDPAETEIAPEIAKDEHLPLSMGNFAAR
jgi:hypothetical protein